MENDDILLAESHNGELTIITALDTVQQLAEGSKLDVDFWASCADEIEYLTDRLGLTPNQAVILAILCEKGEPMSWRMLGEYLGLSRLKTMSLSDDVEALRDMRWIVMTAARERGGMYQGYQSAFGIIKAFRRNEVFVPEQIEGLSLQSFVDKITRYIKKTGRDGSIDYEERVRGALQLVKANMHLDICQATMDINGSLGQMIFLLTLADYVQYAGVSQEGIGISDYAQALDDDEDFDDAVTALCDETHEVFLSNLVEHACQEDGLVDNNVYKITKYVKAELLEGYVIRNNERRRMPTDNDLLKHSDIKAKTLYYNPAEAQQMAQLHHLLADDNLAGIQGRLQENGLPIGITCLFYGTPGTGKTEGVMQLARESGRDVMQVDIAAIRDKYVGETEKNIKDIFLRYKALCKSRKRTPILLFNEADAIFGNRFESTRSSVEKMDNAMQNIILQEMESLEGILIATTNLTGNLDSAFDRRFLFKVEFANPGVEAKKNIWHTKLPQLSDDDCAAVAAEFNLSGGQIENVARKCSIEYAISGQTPSLDQVREYCRGEHLNRSRHTRIGY